MEKLTTLFISVNSFRIDLIRSFVMFEILLFSFSILTFPTNTALGQYSQQGNKLVALNSPSSQQGTSVSVSADGNTAIVGGPTYNGIIGAAWIFTKILGSWYQWGNPLIGTGVISFAANQGTSVSISADGNTAIIGGPGDNSGIGAVWVFINNGNGFEQLGNKLVGTGGIGQQRQGVSAAISGDGNTVVIGGSSDNSNQGAVWVFVRTNGTWIQQGNKLVGTGGVGGSRQGSSVSISYDGNTIIEGGSEDNGGAGAAWIFTRSTMSGWTQSGAKLVGLGAIGNAKQGTSVSISADANTSAVGGRFDNINSGAVWIFAKSGNVWSQQGNKLVGSSGIQPNQGSSVSLSADGNTLVEGGIGDSGSVGAIWLFKRAAGIWTQLGNKLTGTDGDGSANQGCSVSISSDGSTFIEGGRFDGGGITGASWIFTKDPDLCEDFSSPSFPPVGWEESFTGTNYWSQQPQSAYGIDSGCAKFEFYSAVNPNVQSLSTQKFFTAGASSYLTFDHAYAPFGPGFGPDTLVIQTSANSGNTFTALITLLGKADGTGELNTAPATEDIYAPLNNQWRSKIFAIPPATNKIRFIAKSGYGNNLYLDNICVKELPAPVVNTIGVIPEGMFIPVRPFIRLNDTVRVYLHRVDFPNIIVDSAKSVIGDGAYANFLFFNNALSGNYYIVVRQRNTIETWSKIGGQSYLRGGNISYDFIVPGNQSYNNNQKLVWPENGWYGMFSGDVNRDNSVDISDLSRIENAATNFLSGYVVEDLTGDNFVDLNDLAIADNNSFNFVSTQSPPGAEPESLTPGIIQRENAGRKK